MRPRASIGGQLCLVALLALGIQQQQCPQAAPPRQTSGGTGATPLVITTDALPDASLGHTYAAKLEATGGVPPYTWRVIEGALPPGLVLQESGFLSGVPTAAGNYAFTVEVRDSGLPAAPTFPTLPHPMLSPEKQSLRISPASSSP